jgi:glycosyltransferase involved in cell wall biosynthesis/CDP-glycerol glycerophosphotransferase (TagB/SpsB family)
VRAEHHSPEEGPRFTFIIAVYDVAQYLPEFLASIAALDVAAGDLELIFVDDGGTDASAEIIETWLGSCRHLGRLIRKENGGPGSARNAGLGLARGEWISFPDPDDVLTPTYLQLVSSYLATEQSTNAAMLACRPVRFVDDTSRPATPHPLDFKYADGERLVDLEENPKFIHLHTIASFYRAEQIQSHQTRFDEAVRPVFEDAVFNVDYLSRSPRPTIAFLGAAHYFYRKRADQTSLTDSAWRDPAILAELPERGYLAVLERSGDPVPRWIQHTVFYDLQWLFRADARLRLAASLLTTESLRRLHDVLDGIVRHLDEAALLEFHAVDIPVRIRLWLVARKGAGLPAQSAYVTKLDVAQQIMQLTYFTDVARPDEDLRIEGMPILPTYAKTTSIRFFGESCVYQRDVWVPSMRPISVRIGGRLLPIVYGPPAGPLFETAPREVWTRYAGEPPPIVGSRGGEPGPGPARPSSRGVGRREEARIGRGSSRGVRLARRLVRASHWSARLMVNDLVPSVSLKSAPSPALTSAVRRRARSPEVRRRYGDGWILVDRDVSAQDNAEAFYRYLRDHRPETNAWFALSRDSPDWSRLQDDGFRLIEFGSVNYALALRNARYLISSQADSYIVRPPQPWSGPRRWKFVFLQHGVIHNDLSRWLNAQPIRMMITTTEAEHRSIVGDGSGYLLSDKEVARTGLPRHDRLLDVSRRLPAERRRSILIAPTWRQQLLGPQGAGHRRELVGDLDGSVFISAWRDLLDNAALRELAECNALDLVFLAHPHLQHHIRSDMLPPQTRLATAGSSDVQQVLAEARLLITDYSSLAFDVAYLGGPVIYYQFDAAEFFSGAHTVQPGEFSYVRDGFGPVVDDADSVVAAAADLLDPASHAREEYRRRADSTFSFRDGRCSERVYEAIRFRERPLTIDRSHHD